MKNIDELIAKLESYEDYDGFNDDLVVALREQRDEIARAKSSDDAWRILCCGKQKIIDALQEQLRLANVDAANMEAERNDMLDLTPIGPGRTVNDALAERDAGAKP